MIGGGDSGTEIVQKLSKIAARITFSQRTHPNETEEEREKRKSSMPPKTTLQDEVTRFTATGAEFVDGTNETFSVVIFATGSVQLCVDFTIKYIDNNEKKYLLNNRL